MEDYRKKVIEFVRDRPLIWDPKHPDYHNKDQRKQVWEDIDNKCPPAGTNTNSKTIWESLTKSFSNALRRKSNKPSGSEAGTEREWKCTKDMMFLLPVKTTRKTSGNVVVPDLDTTMNYYVDNEERPTFQSQPDVADSQPDFVDQPSQDDTQVETETTVRSQTDVGNRMQEAPKKRKVVQKPDRDDTTNTILEIMKQRQLDKSKESPRLNFFRSIMPSIDSLDEDQFVSFQMDVLQALQRQKRVIRHSGAYQQQQQTPSPNLSEASSDSYLGYYTYRPQPGPSRQQQVDYPETESQSYQSYQRM